MADLKRSSPSVVIATLGGLGFHTKMPGTLGSAAACLFYVFLPVPWWGVLALGLLGTWAADACARAMGLEDPGCIVVDEAVGMWVSLYALPLSFALPAFFLFRVVDIIKPFPVSAAERLRGGVGIMADDVVGGVMVNLFLQAINGYLWGEGWLWALLAR
ncbi:MAG: phosphatidylglycerophosphatase A [Fretibacterium sp.]|nr:phosphatidylglycerophosphatase A [Fretibacterium sp.]